MHDSETTPPEREPEAREVWAPRACAVIGLLLALVYLFVPDAGPGDFCVDDAWIHLAYAKSLRLGDGLSYNPGDWETGFSSPLWVVLLAAWPTEPDPVVSVKLLGALLHGCVAGLSSALALELARRRATLERPVPVLSIALLAGILAATAPTLLQSAGSGMEIGLTATLLLATVLASVREQWLLAAILAFLAQLARPEALFFLGTFAALSAVLPQPPATSTAAGGDAPPWRRRALALSPAVGAAAAMVVWILYCQVVSGYPWPNTAYVKADLGDASLGGGLDYLGAQVLPWQPWVIGLGGGMALIAAALWTDLSGRGVLEREAEGQPASKPEAVTRHWQLLALLLAWAAGLIATAASRPLDPGILFYQSRYFAIFAALPPVLIALGVARTHKLLVVALLLPVAVFTGLQVTEVRALQRAQERGVALLHGDPAQQLREQLPPDAVIAVEGAGTARYRTPRTMTIVDIIGLNDAEVAHADGDADKACVIARRRPDAFVLPDHIAAALSKVFVLRPLAEFEDARWAQIEEPREVRVLLLAVDGVHPHWAARCGLD